MDHKNDISDILTSSTSANPDVTAADRKKDHIELALRSRTGTSQIDDRFYYEPLFAGHPDTNGKFHPFTFLQKAMRLPIWVSSMTGGTEMAGIINKNLARACGEFGMGMGLGSCRQLLYNDEHLSDFAVRNLIGPDQPLYANLGIAQVEQLLADGKTSLIDELLTKLEADGLIIHINPLQEWFQPEGDLIKRPAIDTIKRMLDIATYPIIIKEVGQGMGRASLEALLTLPLEAVDFAAMGGTNFSKLELLRNSDKAAFAQLALVGHSANEMVEMTNDILASSSEIKCRQIIISGGVSNFLDGYYLTQKINTAAIYGQASAFLEHARGSYEDLQRYIQGQAEGLAIADAFLKIKA